MMRKIRYYTFLVLFLGLSVAGELTLGKYWDYVPSLSLLAVICVTQGENRNTGAVVGMIVGFVSDLTLSASLCLSPLFYPITAWYIGSRKGALGRRDYVEYLLSVLWALPVLFIRAVITTAVSFGTFSFLMVLSGLLYCLVTLTAGCIFYWVGRFFFRLMGRKERRH